MHAVRRRLHASNFLVRFSIFRFRLDLKTNLRPSLRRSAYVRVVYSGEGPTPAACAFATTVSARFIAALSSSLCHMATDRPSSNDRSLASCARKNSSRSVSMASASSLGSPSFPIGRVISFSRSHRTVTIGAHGWQGKRLAAGPGLCGWLRWGIGHADIAPCWRSRRFLEGNQSTGRHRPAAQGGFAS